MGQNVLFLNAFKPNCVTRTHIQKPNQCSQSILPTNGSTSTAITLKNGFVLLDLQLREI